MSDGYGVSWRVAFLATDDPYWFDKHTDEVVDALATTALWKELQVYGAPRERGRPFKGVATIKRALIPPRVVALARGDRDATVARTQTPARLTIEPQEGALTMTAAARGESLARLGARVLTEVAEVIADLARRWRGQARLASAWAIPVDHPRPFPYPRVHPPRVTTPFRAMSAIVDVLDPTFAETPRSRANLHATRTMAAAALPDGVVRTEQDSVVIQRWVDDPRDRAAVAAAASRHEQWLLKLLPTETAPGWNDQGDEQLGGMPGPAEGPFAAVVHDTSAERDLHHAVVAVDASDEGAVSDAIWAQVEPLAQQRSLRDGTPLDEVWLLAPSRAAAVALAGRGHAAGFDRVVYRDAQRTFWDPDPPWPWANRGP